MPGIENKIYGVLGYDRKLKVPRHGRRWNDQIIRISHALVKFLCHITYLLSIYGCKILKWNIKQCTIKNKTNKKIKINYASITDCE